MDGEDLWQSRPEGPWTNPGLERGLGPRELEDTLPSRIQDWISRGPKLQSTQIESLVVWLRPSKNGRVKVKVT